jgi:hypothetical protein
MNASLRMFVHQYLGLVAAALVPVVLAAFVCIPLSLGAHPGEPRPTDTFADQHMT